uniref:Transcription elongation regulator 1-like protein n=1 Tax=Panthera tigris altaica TaxID=74533 RepID=A0A8C9M498_PANTA
ATRSTGPGPRLAALGAPLTPFPEGSAAVQVGDLLPSPGSLGHPPSVGPPVLHGPPDTGPLMSLARLDIPPPTPRLGCTLSPNPVSSAAGGRGVGGSRPASQRPPGRALSRLEHSWWVAGSRGHGLQPRWGSLGSGVLLQAGAPGMDKSRERGRAPCPPGLMLHADRKSRAGDGEDKEPPSILVTREDSAAKGNRPVASTPVPGSPWCVVWTGDDRVFFFNPTMQLSVWEKPMDLKNRGDLNRIIEDPPHKRKLEAPTADHSDGSRSEDGREDRNMRTKRNRTEGHASPGPEEAEGADKDTKTPPPQILLPLEERVTHFRDMLLERGVSAFSTWEKELHKIVFDPRYLLLNSEERKQIFEQFVKTRIKEEYKEKKNKLLLAKEEFKKLLEESKVSPRTTFKEFAEKYGRDQRFRLVQRKKDQEHFFNQFILILKKRDKENRLRLRKMR